MDEPFLNKLVTAHQACNECPNAQEIDIFFKDFLGLLFPTFASQAIKDVDRLKEGFEELKLRFSGLLSGQDSLDRGQVIADIYAFIPAYYELLLKDVEAIFNGDPAANSEEEVIRSYPGFYAIASYRFAHELFKHKVAILPRAITELAHSRTGIDIHPAATIGEYFCIDHGTGVVIGETTTIGDHVKVYQGVTLGALSIEKEMANTKRHPTIEDHVIIYSGATILGGETRIGAHSIIGGNVWLVSSVPAHAKVYYKSKKGERELQLEVAQDQKS